VIGSRDAGATQSVIMIAKEVFLEGVRINGKIPSPRRPAHDSEQLRTARRVPRTKTLRRALGLTQEEFAARYNIPLGTLRDWEQGRCEPDQPARAHLAVIAHDPEGVKRALAEKHR